MNNITKQLVYATPFFIFLIYTIVVAGLNDSFLGKEGLEISFQFDWYLYSLILSVLIASFISRLLRSFHPDKLGRFYILLSTIGALSYCIYGTTQFLNYKFANKKAVSDIYFLGPEVINNDGGKCYYLLNKKNGEKISSQAFCKKSHQNIHEGFPVKVKIQEGWLSRTWVSQYVISL
ncbi:hypothetical protein DAY19_08585 [Halobacteriovorax vibrionivorans]|uniref:Uncharacterized protein n=1 Tax=Halobacteriovorax vibrionivorans TaxID=2152716 RepID=A0ABY0IIP6_9BACT|nr:MULTISPECIES: hypothetical protein [Halobacteriovorax]RZF21736.1 hypothetical protein DAY19_08585 [Halobacteriovorax vibrionivorans]TGD45643.1 hypothetical protein EP118_15045 [Halobacteriovorax sp. Y22]